MIMQELKKTEIIDELPEGLDWGLTAINAEKAWEVTKGKGAKIAVIDTGIDMNHPDFKESLKGTINMHKHIKDVTDEYGHGTHVAGLITGKHTGIAPEAELYVAKVLDEKGKGTMANVLDGISFAINYDVDVLCMSLGVPAKLPVPLEQRLFDARAKGITVVCAVGNGGKNRLEFPSKYEDIIAVGGVDKDLKHAKFSNYGAEIDISAPSIDVLSTYKDGNYARMTGTSMASPLVAGAVALLISVAKEQGVKLTPYDIKNILSTRLNEDHSYRYGWGVLDLEKLLFAF